MKAFRTVLTFLFFGGACSIAHAGFCLPYNQPIFENQKHDQYSQKASVSIESVAMNAMNFRVMLPCSNRSTPTVFRVLCDYNYDNRPYEDLSIEQQGDGQCSLGNDPKIHIAEGVLTIITDEFDYEFYEQD